MSKLRQYADALERTTWTLVETAGAVGLVAGYNATPLPDLPLGWSAVTVVVLGALIAAGKGIIVTNTGNGTASTLKPGLEPVPAAVVEKLEAVIAASPPGPVTEVVPLNEPGPVDWQTTMPNGPRPAYADADGNGRDDRTGRFVPKGGDHPLG